MLILETKSILFSRYIHGAVQNEYKNLEIFLYTVVLKGVPIPMPLSNNMGMKGMTENTKSAVQYN